MELFYNSYEISEIIAKNIKKIRLYQNLTQEALAKKSGVSLGSMKRFENQYEISLKNLIKLAMALGVEDDLLSLFKKESPKSIDDIIKENKMNYSERKRGRLNE